MLHPAAVAQPKVFCQNEKLMTDKGAESVPAGATACSQMTVSGPLEGSHTMQVWDLKVQNVPLSTSE